MEGWLIKPDRVFWRRLAIPNSEHSLRKGIKNLRAYDDFFFWQKLEFQANENKIFEKL
jgi:hypothetical protein